MPYYCFLCDRSRRARRSCQQRWPTSTVWWKIWTPSPSRTLRCSHPACYGISHLSSCHLHLNSLILDGQLNYGPLYSMERQTLWRLCVDFVLWSQSWKELLCGPIVIRNWSGEKQYCQKLEGCPNVCDCAECELMRIGELRLQTLDNWPPTCVTGHLQRETRYCVWITSSIEMPYWTIFFIYFICISLNRVNL